MSTKFFVPETSTKKEYLVTVNKPITDDFVQKMSNGVPILGETTKKCRVVKESVFSFRITLIQGLNRQIRRMCEHFEYDVVKLERIRIMNINLKGIPLGEWRQLEPSEMEQIMEAIANSSSEARTKSQEPRAKTIDQRPKNSGQRAPSTVGTKKPDRSSVANPKSRELRSNSSSSSVKKGGVPKNNKPSSSSSGNKGNSKSGRR